jgi:type II secretory ATPase GspE/PulE/Tfp pilus assembly ATPase PilB-like protein
LERFEEAIRMPFGIVLVTGHLVLSTLHTSAAIGAAVVQEVS